jgi:hypothetical protein
MRFALITAPELFYTASAALEGLPAETLSAIRRRILSTDGLVELDDLVDGTTQVVSPSTESGGAPTEAAE